MRNAGGELGHPVPPKKLCVYILCDAPHLVFCFQIFRRPTNRCWMSFANFWVHIFFRIKSSLLACWSLPSYAPVRRWQSQRLGGSYMSVFSYFCQLHFLRFLRGSAMAFEFHWDGKGEMASHPSPVLFGSQGLKLLWLRRVCHFEAAKILVAVQKFWSIGDEMRHNLFRE